MNRESLLKELEKVNYPGLEKSIVQMKVVKEVTEKDGKSTVLLSMQNDEAFMKIKSTLEDMFGDSVMIEREAPAKKSINYGNTSNPNNRAPYAKRVIAVTSGKGGVGKSTVSVNLAVALAQKGFKVGLLDADVYGPNVPRMVGTAHEKLQWNENDKIVPSENFGIKIMSVGLTTPSSDTPLVWRSSVAVSALIQFLEDVEWGELDFLVIDMPPGTGDIQLTMAQELPISAGVIVTTPQPVALDDVSRAIMMFKDINVPIGGLVENMSYFIAPDTKKRYDIFGSGGGEETAKRYSIPFLGRIPLDMRIRELSDEGRPPVAMGDKLQKEFYKDIADNLMKEIS
ncbi:ATP-binding protein [Hydrogenimonas sp.]|nr:ATP-binding protein [Hydrogenimonas sp.]